MNRKTESKTYPYVKGLEQHLLNRAAGKGCGLPW